MSTLTTKQLSLAYDDLPIISDLDLIIPHGKITALVGPNGCGKSTLLRGLARLLRPRGGAVYLDGDEIHRLPTRLVAKRLGLLPQTPVAPEGLTVRDLAAQGRYPHQSWFQQWSSEDERFTNQALDITGMTALAHRSVDTLSGGQRQRAWIAMTLAQNTETVLLDEPTTYLDLAHQLEVLQVLQHLNQQAGRTIVMVLHDLNHAARFADHIVALKAGEVVAEGTPQAVLVPRLLHDVFGVLADVIQDPRTGTPFCIPYAIAQPQSAEEPSLEIGSRR